MHDLKAVLAGAAQLHGRIADGQHRSLLELPNLLGEAGEAFEKQRSDARISATAKQNDLTFSASLSAAFRVTTHQTVLCQFGRSMGSHGQGNLFLRLLLNLLTVRTGIALAAPDGLWEVDHGLSYIDVRLRHSSTNDAVVIETKWEAGDRPGQVDYWDNELQRRRKTRIPVVFITKDGRPPNLGPPREVRTRFKRDLMCLSYRREFSELLRSALEDVQAPRVRETLVQHLELLAAIETDYEQGEEQ